MPTGLIVNGRKAAYDTVKPTKHTRFPSNSAAIDVLALGFGSRRSAGVLTLVYTTNLLKKYYIITDK